MDAIGDYGIIGDGRSAALVSKRGSIDWLCWPRFDSPSLFGALLDPEAGRFRIAPTESFRTERWYVPRTNVLCTRFITPSARFVVTDLMTVASEEDKRRVFVPEHEVLRILECESGEGEVEVLFEPRPRYGAMVPKVRRAGALGVRAETPEGVLYFRADVPLALDAEGAACARTRMRAGQRHCFSLTSSDDWQAVLPPLGDFSRAVLERSVAWWRGWASKVHYQGPAQEHVLRSALALKLLVYAPSGATVAAPTTSLPERMGGELNWDYRFCWLRDAALTVRALFGIGCTAEAETFVSWLLHSTRLSLPELRVLYDVYGRSPPRERELPHLAGYRGSRPVRIGNEAGGQLQLDVYGEVIEATAHFVHHGGELDREARDMLRQLGRYVCEHWHEPDEGIWEPRSGRRHHTHSRLLCWTALDRLLTLHELGHLPKVPADEMRRGRDAIRHEIETRGYDARLESYVSELDGSELDASLLLIPWYRFEPADSRRMRGTYAKIRERLGVRGDLLRRYTTPDSPGEGAFGICSFWGAEFLALGGGTAAEAEALFRRVCGYGNDLGLFGEEVDLETGAPVGNFPQAFSHVGLINAALSLEERLRGEEPLSREALGAAAEPKEERV